MSFQSRQLGSKGKLRLIADFFFRFIIQWYWAAPSESLWLQPIDTGVSWDNFQTFSKTVLQKPLSRPYTPCVLWIVQAPCTEATCGRRREGKIPRDGGDSGQASHLSLICSYFGVCETILSCISCSLSLSLRFLLLLLPIGLFCVVLLL